MISGKGPKTEAEGAKTLIILFLSALRFVVLGEDIMVNGCDSNVIAASARSRLG